MFRAVTVLRSIDVPHGVPSLRLLRANTKQVFLTAKKNPAPGDGNRCPRGLAARIGAE
jgi:hypothetical protein